MKNTKKTKRTFKFFAAWDYEFEEQEFDRMSEQGWQLVSGGCFTQKYEFDDSVVYRYQIDYNNDVKDMARYDETFRDAGWERVNSNFNGWHIFRVPRGNAQTLEESLLHRLRHGADQFRQCFTYSGYERRGFYRRGTHAGLRHDVWYAHCRRSQHQPHDRRTEEHPPLSDQVLSHFPLSAARRACGFRRFRPDSGRLLLCPRADGGIDFRSGHSCGFDRSCQKEIIGSINKKTKLTAYAAVCRLT